MDRIDLRIFGKQMRRKRRKGLVELLEKTGKPKELKTTRKLSKEQKILKKMKTAKRMCQKQRETERNDQEWTFIPKKKQ